MTFPRILPSTGDVLTRALIAACLIASTAGAESRVTLRLDLPTIMRGDEEGWFQIFGATASVRLRELVAAEVEAGYSADACVSGFLLTARGGVAPVFAERGTWAFSVPALAGLTYGTLDGGGCDGNPDETVLAVTAAVGIEASRVKRGAAFRLLVAGGKRRDEHYDGSMEWDTMYTATLSVGYTFPP